MCKSHVIRMTYSSIFKNWKSTVEDLFLFSRTFQTLKDWKIPDFQGSAGTLHHRAQLQRANRSKMPKTLAIATKCEEWSLSTDDSTPNTRQLPVRHHSPHLPRSPPAQHFVRQSLQHRSFLTSAWCRPDWIAAENSVPETATVCSSADAGSSTFRILDKLSSADSSPEIYTRINLR